MSPVTEPDIAPGTFYKHIFPAHRSVESKVKREIASIASTPFDPKKIGQIAATQIEAVRQCSSIDKRGSPCLSLLDSSG